MHEPRHPQCIYGYYAYDDRDACGGIGTPCVWARGMFGGIVRVMVRAVGGMCVMVCVSGGGGVLGGMRTLGGVRAVGGMCVMVCVSGGGGVLGGMRTLGGVHAIGDMRTLGGVWCVRGSVGWRCMRRRLCGCGGMRAVGDMRTLGGVWCVRGSVGWRCMRRRLCGCGGVHAVGGMCCVHGHGPPQQMP